LGKRGRGEVQTDVWQAATLCYATKQEKLSQKEVKEKKEMEEEQDTCTSGG